MNFQIELDYQNAKLLTPNVVLSPCQMKKSLCISLTVPWWSSSGGCCHWARLPPPWSRCCSSPFSSRTPPPPCSPFHLIPLIASLELCCVHEMSNITLSIVNITISQSSLKAVKKSDNPSNSHATIRKLIKTVLSSYRNLVKERFINRVSKLLFCKGKNVKKMRYTLFWVLPKWASPCPSLNVSIFQK